MRKPLGIIFDLGNTVIVQQSFNSLAGNSRLLEFAHNPQNLTPEEIQNMADDLFREINRIRTKSMIEFPYPSFQKLLYEYLDISSNISYSEMEREFWNTAATYSPAEGICEILDNLESNHIKTGILSNASFSGMTLTEELVKHNLAHHFAFVISSADYGFRKPSKYIFKVAIKKINLNPEEIWFAGDDLDCDIIGATNAGLYPVWYNPRNEALNKKCTCLEINHWHQLLEKIISFNS